MLSTAASAVPRTIKGQQTKSLLSSGGRMALFGASNDPGFPLYEFGPPGDPDRDPPDDPGQEPSSISSSGNPQPGYHDNGRGGNSFANDPCLDPPAPNRRRTVQSETELAVLNKPGSMGKNIVVGFNDSWGFYDNRQGLSGFAYSVNGGNTFIDGGGLPPAIPAGLPAGTPGQDAYFGDPVVVVHNASETFYYSSIYLLPTGIFGLSVNRGRFRAAPPSTPESMSNTRCLKDPSQQGVPDTSNLPKERIVWERPVVAVAGVSPDDLLDKEWLFVDQGTGELYLTYTRFSADGSTPLELVRSFDGGHTWTPPSVIIPNLIDTFNQATQPVKLPSGRLIVTWIARTFALAGNGPESENRIEVAFSDNDGVTFSAPIIVNRVNPQGEPPGYNRGRRSILNAPYMNFDDVTGAVYITYFHGKTSLTLPGGGIFTGPLAKQADILLSRSNDGGLTWQTTKVNDDPGLTSHVFPSVNVDKHGFVYAGWMDRRNDPTANELSDFWANVSHDGGISFGHDKQQNDVSTSWRVRADARPNFGDYNSSDLLGFDRFVMTWADGRFPPPAPAPQAATPDVIFTIANGLGVGGP